MSTRGAIARPKGDGWEGRYHHWDSYPEGLGETLWNVYHNTFGRDLEAMVRFLIDDHPEGWSTINNADWSLPAQRELDHNLLVCSVCSRPSWKHYRQYYNTDYNKPKRKPPAGGTAILVYDHSPQTKPQRHGPICYCHGDVLESGDTNELLTHKNASAAGVEFVYVLTPNHPDQMIILGSYQTDGKKMIGMFGRGAPDAHWKLIDVVDLSGPEPDWQQIQKIVWPS